MTQAEKEQLEAELEEYKLVRRPEVVERIKIARGIAIHNLKTKN